jgi:predicted CXXCH cytochrome family protein
MRTERKVLRRLALVAAASAALFMGTVPAYADNGPHVSTATNAETSGIKITDAGQGRCASCHRAHTAKAAYLLNATSEESLCFSCHGGSGTGATTDVQNGVGYGATASTGITLTRDAAVVGALRGGGFDQAMLGTGAATKDIYFNTSRGSYSSRNQLIPPAEAPAETTSSHFAGVGIMWGNGALSATPNAGKDMSTTTTTKLECSSCHDPHGNKQYRILKPVPSDSGFATVIPGNTQAGVFIKDTANKVYTTANYWIAGDPAAVADTATRTYLGGTSSTNPTPVQKTLSSTAPDISSFQANVAAWCTTCHTRYLAPSGSWRTNSGDAIFTYRHTGDNVSGDAASNRNCIQCHVAHGSNAVMPNSSVENPGDTTPSTDSRLLRVDDRGVCVMCHNV